MKKTGNETWVAKQKDVPIGTRARILYLDLEISPMLSYNYEAYESNALKILKSPMLVSFGWQWEGEKDVHCVALPDYKGYRKGIFKLDDKKIVKDLYDIMMQADVIIGHNIKDFDIKIARTRFLAHGLPVTKKWDTVDTLKVSRSQFRFPKNNLDYVTGFVGLEGKSDLKHSDLIWGCIDGDLVKWRKMKDYNKQDIKITREYYLKIRGWDTTHTNLSFYSRQLHVCPNCEGKKFHRHGKRWYRNGLRWVYRCLDCGSERPYGDIIKEEKIKSY